MRLRQAFSGQSTRSKLLDLVLLLAAPYVVIGAIVAAFEQDFTRRLEADLAAHIPVFFDLLALGLTIMAWPVLLVLSLFGSL